MRNIFIYSAFKDLFGDFCQVSSVTMPASLPPQLAKLIQKYPQNHSHINLNSFLKAIRFRTSVVALIYGAKVVYMCASNLHMQVK